MFGKSKKETIQKLLSKIEDLHVEAAKVKKVQKIGYELGIKDKGDMTGSAYNSFEFGGIKFRVNGNGKVQCENCSKTVRYGIDDINKYYWCYNCEAILATEEKSNNQSKIDRSILKICKHISSEDMAMLLTDEDPYVRRVAKLEMKRRKK